MGTPHLTTALPAPQESEKADNICLIQTVLSTTLDSQVLISEQRLLPQPHRRMGAPKVTVARVQLWNSCAAGGPWA